MNINNMVKTQGRSIYEQLQHIKDGNAGKSKNTKDAASKGSSVPANIQDKLDISNPNVTTEINASLEKESQRSSSSSGEIQASNGANVSFQFDLFYSLTSKVEASMGQSGAERFVNLGASVAETFKSSFSLSIDGVGSFMNGTEKSLEISPEVANDFFDAVEGLTKQGPDALENFLKKSDAFFDELENTYGDLGGAFDDIKAQVQSQAKDFMASVGDAQQYVKGEIGTDQQSILDQITATAGEGSEGAEGTEGSEGKNLISMFANPDVKVSQDDYKDFLQKFMDYANRMQQSMFDQLMSMKDSMSSNSSSAADAVKSLLDVNA